MLHDDRRRAESFGADAERYDRSRPSYASAVIDFVLSDAPEGTTVLDVGCGTGIGSRLMVARGMRVTGVEPDERMAAFCQSRGIPVVVSRFENWEPDERRFGVLTAFQSWHWVHPERGAARAAQVIESGGTINLVWNVARPPRDLAHRLDEIYGQRAPGVDAYSVLLGGSRTGGESLDPRFESAVNALADNEDFDEPVHHRVVWPRRYSTSEWLDQLPTHSDHASLAPEVLDSLLEEVGHELDAAGGGFDMEYSTTIIRATRR